MADAPQLHRGGAVTGFAVKGWCPGALRPMESGDGWIVRVRPRGGRLSAAQAAGIGAAAEAFGNGRLDLTARANIQIRGVVPATHAPLIAALSALGLIDDDARVESRRNVLVAPFGPDRLSAALERALEHGPELPPKFGFALDTGDLRWLTRAPADIRIERGTAGLILRADGQKTGLPVTEATAVAAAMDLARRILAGTPAAQGEAVPVPAAPDPLPGRHPEGALVALEFGQIAARIFAGLGEMRLTPWRMLLLTAMPDDPAIITDPADPRLRVVACTGAPACPQGLQPTRPLARRLAPHVPRGQILHVSGCAKGCARKAPAWLTLRGTDAGFDAIPGGGPRDPARLTLRPDWADTAADPFEALRTDAPHL